MFEKTVICSKCVSKDEKIFKEEESIEILKILCLISNIGQYQIIWQNKKQVKNLDQKKWKKEEIIPLKKKKKMNYSFLSNRRDFTAIKFL